MDPIGICLLLSLLSTFGFIDDLYPHLPLPSFQIWFNPNMWRSGMATEWLALGEMCLD
jgi:RimJ/RimL family protein N-acetyltransferase